MLGFVWSLTSLTQSSVDAKTGFRRVEIHRWKLLKSLGHGFKVWADSGIHRQYRIAYKIDRYCGDIALILLILIAL